MSSSNDNNIFGIGSIGQSHDIYHELFVKMSEISALIDDKFASIFGFESIRLSSEDKKRSDRLQAQNNSLHQAIYYCLSNPGKRVRPFLTINFASLFNIPISNSVTIAASIELIHNYSLIHDDLPAMDNDDYRRSRLTCHKKFDEATAILVGDAMLTEAFAVIATDDNISSEVRCNLIAMISEAAGAKGMVGGQMLDIKVSASQYNISSIEQLQSMKTGALIKAACLAALMMGGYKQDDVIYQLTAKYANNIGLAFQIKDDLLDIEEESGNVGKKTGKDKASGKITFIDILGIDQAKERLSQLIMSAIDNLSSIEFQLSQDRNRKGHKSDITETIILLKNFTNAIKERSK